MGKVLIVDDLRIKPGLINTLLKGGNMGDEYYSMPNHELILLLEKRDKEIAILKRAIDALREGNGTTFKVLMDALPKKEPTP